MKYQRLMVALAVAAFLGTTPMDVQAQTAGRISDSPHDLSSDDPLDADKNEVCVYCHTPHGAEGASAGVPLWNKAVGDPASFTLYDAVNSSTIDGEILGSVGGVSLACLSCHDGTQATDTVINKPGTGGYTPGTGSEIDVAAGPFLNTGIANIAEGGTDLSNDHPIAIVYGGHDPGNLWRLPRRAARPVSGRAALRISLSRAGDGTGRRFKTFRR